MTPRPRYGLAAAAAVALLASLSIFAHPAGGIEWTGRWVLITNAGHDSEVLVDPDVTGSIDSKAATFTGVGNQLHLAFARVATRADRISINAAENFVVYSAGHEPGNSQNGFCAGECEYRLFGRAALQARVSRFWSRSDRAEILDQDRTDFAAVLRCPLYRGVFLRVAGERSLPDFSKRVCSDDTTESVNARLTDLRVTLSRTWSAVGTAEIEFADRRTASNEPLSEYQGPSFKTRFASRRFGGLRGYLSLGYSQWDYDHFVEKVLQGDQWIETGKHRSDELTRVSAGFEYAVSPQADLAITWSRARLGSNLPDLGYEQSIFQVTTRISLWNRSEGSDPFRALISRPRTKEDPPAILPHESLPEGVRFRCHEFGARCVYVIGDFNDWADTATPLADDDGDGVWEAVVAMPPGVHRYAFVVNGVCKPPAGAESYEEDDFGGRNAVFIREADSDGSGDKTTGRSVERQGDES